MKSIFTKDMPFEELRKGAERESYRFFEMSRYLNESGKVMKETWDVISDNCIFAETKEDLKRNIEQDIEEKRIKDEKVIKKLNAFIETILQ